jgi:DNA-binding NarL/FixJ family response regulator
MAWMTFQPCFLAVEMKERMTAKSLAPAKEHPDLGLILLDQDLPDRDGFSVLSELRMRHPAISVVVVSAHQDHESVVKALNQGALGFIPKSATREVLLGAMQLVFSGGIYIPPQAPAEEQVPQRPVLPADLGLTEGQMDVLSLIMQGKSNKAICRVLDLSEATVESHVSAVLRALKVSNRVELVLAGRSGASFPSRPRSSSSW